MAKRTSNHSFQTWSIEIYSFSPITWVSIIVTTPIEKVKPPFQSPKQLGVFHPKYLLNNTTHLLELNLS